MEITAVLQALELGQVTLIGQFTSSSNYTFLVSCVFEGLEVKAVYKPVRGQIPLWDFDSESLPKREVAAYLLSDHANWNIVPPTVFREDNLPVGKGSLQLFVANNPDQNYFSLSESERESLKALVVFDLVANNADRKGGHILKDESGRLWAIDHALCFHTERKYRSVIWDFAGQPLPEELLQVLEGLGNDLAEGQSLFLRMEPWLDIAEIEATQQRVLTLVHSGRFPPPDTNRRVIPWPPL
ncbi:MAG: SCO1664 family protein [Anaerolineaceae bacterium]